LIIDGYRFAAAILVIHKTFYRINVCLYVTVTLWSRGKVFVLKISSSFVSTVDFLTSQFYPSPQIKSEFAYENIWEMPDSQHGSNTHVKVHAHSISYCIHITLHYHLKVIKFGHFVCQVKLVYFCFLWIGWE